MYKSARLLGKEYGLTGEEMNRILYKFGFLSGEPGAYYPTEKAMPYVHEQDYHRGVGGYESYNRYWTTRSYDESILNELEITPELIDEVRKELSEIRKSRYADRIVESVSEMANTEREKNVPVINADGQNDNETDIKIIVIGTVIIAGITYIIYKIVNKIKAGRNSISIQMKEDETGEENDSIMNRPLIRAGSINPGKSRIIVGHSSTNTPLTRGGTISSNMTLIRKDSRSTGKPYITVGSGSTGKTLTRVSNGGTYRPLTKQEAGSTSKRIVLHKDSERI